MERWFKPNRVYAVAGASKNPAKFGHKVLKWYQDHDIPAVPINFKEEPVLGLRSVKDVTQVPVAGGYDLAISVVTPPSVTKEMIESFGKTQGKVNSLWLQPGTYTPDVLELARATVPDVITDCILVKGDSYYSQSRL